MQEGVAECCGVCRFRVNRECHRNPPFLMIVGSRYDPVWPVVKDYQWCGEFRVKDVIEASFAGTIDCLGHENA